MKFFLLFLALLPALPAEASLWRACALQFQKLAGEKPEWLADDVEIILFPEGHHTKLRVKNKVYANTAQICMKGNCTQTSVEAMQKLTESRLGKGLQVRYSVRVTPQELKRLEKFLADGKFEGGVTCTQAVCRALSKNTGTFTPVPFNISPILNGIYLALNRMVPGGRVTKMKFHFPAGFQAGLGDAAFVSILEVITLPSIGIGVYAIHGFLEESQKISEQRRKWMEEYNQARAQTKKAANESASP